MKSFPRRLSIVIACLLLALSMTACRTAAPVTASMPMSFGCSSPVRDVPPPEPAPIAAAPAPLPAPVMEVAPAPEPVPAPQPTRRVLRKN